MVRIVDIVSYMEFVKFTKQLLILVYLLDLYSMKLGQPLIKLLRFQNLYLWRLGAVLKHGKVSNYYGKDCRHCVLYGIRKVHKAIVDLCLSFRAIFY